jgi:hypothetical protein
MVQQFSLAGKTNQDITSPSFQNRRALHSKSPFLGGVTDAWIL